MPELPEVEAVRSSLEPLICGHRITKAAVFHRSVISPLSEQAFCQGLEQGWITKVDRRGKYLLLGIEKKNAAKASFGDVLMVHLRMTGQLVCEEKTAPIKKHTHVILSLENGQEIRFTDARRFGKMTVLPRGDVSSCSGLRTLGPEPLSEEFSPTYFYEKIHPKKVKIKTALLDQRIVAGLGNIYADEVLFASSILPERLCCGLTQKEAAVLCEKIKLVLTDAIAHKGTSFRDYIDGEGKKGGHQEFLQVYQREDLPCYVCGTAIRRVKIAGRSSHFCPHCQK